MIVVIACLYTRSARGHARSPRRRGIRHDGGDGGGGWDGDGGGGGYGGDGGGGFGGGDGGGEVKTEAEVDDLLYIVGQMTLYRMIIVIFINKNYVI